MPRAGIVLVAWSGWRATSGRDVLNRRGWPSFSEFWQAAFRPELAPDFLRLTFEAAGTTAAYALLGTVVSVAVGVVGGFVVAERPWESTTEWHPTVAMRQALRYVVRASFVVPRAMHEVIWALLLVQVFGFDPWVAILAIGIQFGAITAKVFGELIDDADPSAFRSLRAAGGGRLTSVIYGIVPQVRSDALSYGFYRLECSVRSAAVLGIVGAGGLGFQLDLSFESLRYDELWTIIAALMVLSGLVDWWSSWLRRSANADAARLSWLACLVAIPLAAWHIDLDLGGLVSARTRSQAIVLLGDLLPPRLGPGGWADLWQATLDTLAMSTLATLLAGVGGLVFAVVAARPPGERPRVARPVVAWCTRVLLLLFRSVPSPVWAFLLVLVVFPGIWPGAIALGVYNLGVLGRLFAEVMEDHDDRARRQLDTAGAAVGAQLIYAVLPMVRSRLVALTLYRWEVITRETVVVGVVGAAGLGRLMQEHLVARDYAAVLGAVGALAVLALVIDVASAKLRRIWT